MLEKNVVVGVVGRRRSELPELKLIDDIDDLIADFKERHSGEEPVRVSHWDPSEWFVKAILNRVDLAKFSNPKSYVLDPIHYAYSYLLKRRRGDLEPVLTKLGFNSSSVSIQVMENGTSAIAAVANWLKVTGVSDVVLLRPYYFAVSRNLERLNLRLRHVSMLRRDGEYVIPEDLPVAPGQALWITNPTYSTSVYSPESQLERLKDLADRGIVIIADEALAIPPSKLAAELGGHPNFIGIYTPHKSICMNGLKFSAVVHHPSTGDTFDHWSDVLSGGLSLSAVMALHHFTQPEFDEYKTIFFKLIEGVRSWHNSAVSGVTEMRTDAFARGHFISVYFPNLRATLGDDVSFLAELMEETGATIISGTRSGLDPSNGLSFRVNLAQDSPEFRSSLCNLYANLGAKARGLRAA